MKKLADNNILSNEDKALLHRCTQEIRKIALDSEVILYGSRARGQEELDSDYDILVLINEPAGLDKEDSIRQQLFPIELETGRVFTVNVFNKKDWDSSLYRAMPFHHNVNVDGILL